MANTNRSEKRKKSLKPTNNISKFLSILLIISGSAILFWASYKPVSQIRLSSTKTEAALSTPNDPLKIFIPRLNKTLYIEDGYVVGDRWTTTRTGVSYYTASSLPGDGNTVLYGHNTKDILGSLWRVETGDTIYVVLKSGEFVEYQVETETEIQPTQVEILDQTEDTRLTIYTCSGFLDESRFVVVAKTISSI